jgi:hypothetical protein
MVILHITYSTEKCLKKMKNYLEKLEKNYIHVYLTIFINIIF